jgi:hypothetical protein
MSTLCHIHAKPGFSRRAHSFFEDSKFALQQAIEIAGAQIRHAVGAWPGKATQERRKQLLF